MASTAALETRRVLAERRMLDLCDIVTDVNVGDGEGGYTETTTTLADAIPCRMAYLSGRELQRAAQIRGEADVVVTLPALQEVPLDGRLVVTNAETGEEYELEVLHVGRRSVEITRRVLCKNLSA